MQGYACTRGLRSLAAHRALRIDFYTFKCARPFLAVFWRFFRDCAQKSKIFPNQTGSGRSHPRGRARLCMHKGPTKPRGAPRPQNRLLYIQVRSVVLAISGRFFLFLPGPGPFIGFFHRVSKFQPRGRATICVVRHHTEPRVAPPRNPNVLYFRRRSPRLSLFL